METYIALLRGVNVGGARKIKMADFRAHAQALPLENPRTYIQSGNLVFNSRKTPPEEAARRLEAMIKRKYGFSISVHVQTAADLEYALRKNPFQKVSAGDAGKVQFVFAKSSPEAELVQALQAIDHGSEQWKVQGNLIYYHAPDGYGRAKMGNNYFEKNLNITATSRNRNTVEKLLKMARETRAS